MNYCFTPTKQERIFHGEAAGHDPFGAHLRGWQQKKKSVWTFVVSQFVKEEVNVLDAIKI